MTNWGLLEYALDTAISDARVALEERRKDYAGFEHLADLPEYEKELDALRRARAELDALHRRIGDAPVVRASPVTTAGQTWVAVNGIEHPELAGKAVRLLLAEPGDKLPPVSAQAASCRPESA